jgi:hypothetical protein
MQKFKRLSAVALEKTTADGTIIDINTNGGDIPKVGDKVYIDGKPAPNDSYVMPDGSIIIVTDGAISEIENFEAKELEKMIGELESKLMKLKALYKLNPVDAAIARRKARELRKN